MLTLLIAACSDSKADLTLGAYAIESDCAGAETQGQVTLTRESPNIFRAEGSTAFGMPDELIERQDQGLLQSTGTDRSCRSRAYRDESQLMFVCFPATSETPECTILLKRL